MKSFWLLFWHSGEERRSEPVGPWLAGGPDGSIDGSRFFRRHPNGKNNRGAFFREAGPAHFLLHAKVYFRIRKCLTLWLTLVYNRLISKFETRPCRKNARPSLARLANRGHPVATGAANGRLATKAFSYKVERIGSEQPGEVAP